MKRQVILLPLVLFTGCSSIAMRNPAVKQQNGVDWLLGETYAPVTLEADLVYVKDGTTIWRDSYFITKNEDELEKLSPDEGEDKSRQLTASLHKAELKLIEKLNSYLTSELL